MHTSFYLYILFYGVLLLYYSFWSKVWQILFHCDTKATDLSTYLVQMWSLLENMDMHDGESKYCAAKWHYIASNLQLQMICNSFFQSFLSSSVLCSSPFSITLVEGRTMCHRHQRSVQVTGPLQIERSNVLVPELTRGTKLLELTSMATNYWNPNIYSSFSIQLTSLGAPFPFSVNILGPSAALLCDTLGWPFIDPHGRKRVSWQWFDYFIMVKPTTVVT